jgi:Protein of unknown function (DUF2865)
MHEPFESLADQCQYVFCGDGMHKRSEKRLVFCTLASALILSMTSHAKAEDFFSALFGANRTATRSESETSAPLSFATEGDYGRLSRSSESARPRLGYSGGSHAFCVRTCDGRYFPITASDGQSRAASCNSFCPAGETKVFYGGSIDRAVTEDGKSYSELPNALRYRNEIVAGCTCNGKDQIGLASIKIENDPTLRKGDIVADAAGLMVAGRSADKRGASLDFSPASASVRARYERLPRVASD